jgi:hypothetical protein
LWRLDPIRHGGNRSKLQLIRLVSWVFRLVSFLGSGLCVLGGSPLRSIYPLNGGMHSFVVEAAKQAQIVEARRSMVETDKESTTDQAGVLGVSLPTVSFLGSPDLCVCWVAALRNSSCYPSQRWHAFSFR